MFVFVSSLIVNVALYISLIIVKRGTKQVWSEQFGNAVILSSSGIISFSIATNAAFLFKAELISTWMILIIVGVAIGIGSGTLVRELSLFTGGYYGMIGGLMGAMLSAVVLNPSLCSLPTDSVHSVEQNSLIFGTFSTFLSVVTCGLFFFLFKRTQKESAK